jgi:hypothetical protein
MTATGPPKRLSKRDVETLLETYDVDPVAALQTALRRLCGQPDAQFDQLLRHLATRGRLSPTRHQLLARRDVEALDSLAGELNETRTLPS